MLEIKTINHEQINMSFGKVFSIYGISSIAPDDEIHLEEKFMVSPPFYIQVAGETFGGHSNMMTGASTLALEFECTKFEEAEQKLLLEYYHNRLSILVSVEFEFIKGASVIRQTNKVTNCSTEDIIITSFSSANIFGVAQCGLKKWYEKNKIKLHTCMQTWQGEGQWRENSLAEFNMYPNSVHALNNSIQVTSIGSWSTCKYYPAGMLEDLETGQIWYYQIETSGSWSYEIGVKKIADGCEGSLYIELGSADQYTMGWYKKLSPKEEYCADPVAFGCVNGGFDEAVCELTKYRRNYLKTQNAWAGECPVFYNDYMNAVWGNPTMEKLLPIIKAAKEVGMEGFCIDAGWFSPLENVIGNGLGDWESSNDRFSPFGIKGVIDEIKNSGMIPGLWLEIDACQIGSRLFKREDDLFLQRFGKRIGNERCFLDFRNEEVCYLMEKAISDLVEMGVGFFKNDYNQSVGYGDDKSNGSFAQGLKENNIAFYAFMDKMRAKHPNVIFENCGGGALRSDNAILSHFHLQSTSDQEIYTLNPSIISGSLANILPEQAGVWAYPYPLLFLEREKRTLDKLFTDEEMLEMADGEQTIFNMVTGLCGNLYLSGRIEYADELNKNLIKEAIELYKRIRPITHNGYVVWPNGRKLLSNDESNVLGILDSKKEKMFLAVWRLNCNEEVIQVNLSKWATEKTKAKLVYPSIANGRDFCYNIGNRTLSVKMNKRNQGAFFEIDLK